MTVSRVINGEGSVRPQTREAVNEAIAALRYTPNPAARSLAGGEQLRVGLFYSNPSQGFLSEYLLGSLDQARASDVQIIVERCDSEDLALDTARHLVGAGVDGVVLPPPLCECAPLLSFFAEAGVPTVTVATGLAVAGAKAIGIDDRAAATAMTQHVLSLGHRRIGFIGGDPILSASARRFEGFKDGLADAGIELQPDLIVEGLFTYRSGLDAAERLLGLAEPPTAIISSNDDMAAATVAVAHRLGMDVPGDLTISGFDDTTLATAIWPELTTIRQPIAQMARLAITSLVARLRDRQGDWPEAQELLNFTFVRRQSDAAPRQRPRTSA